MVCEIDLVIFHLYFKASLLYFSTWVDWEFGVWNAIILIGILQGLYLANTHRTTAINSLIHYFAPGEVVILIQGVSAKNGSHSRGFRTECLLECL